VSTGARAARPAPAGRPAPIGQELRRFAAGVAFVVGVLVFVQLVARFSAGSESPVAAGTLVLGLGLAAAVVYGVAKDSSVGLLVWLLASLFTVIAAGTGPPLDQLAFMALAGGWFLSVVTGRRPLRSFGLTEGLMIAFLVLSVASGFAPHQLGDGGEELQWTTLVLNGAFFPFALFVIARQTVGDRRAVKSFLWFLVWLGLYLTVTAIFYKLGPQQLVFPRAIADEELGINPERARGPLLNSAADGTVLVIAFIAAMYLGVQRGMRFRRFALGAALVMPIGIFYSQTRAVWLAAGLSVVLGAMLARGFRRWYLAVLGGALAVIAINWQKFLSADRQQGGVTSVSEIDSRLNDIATAFWAIGERPVFGWGIGRFPEVNTVYHRAWGDLDWNLGYGFLGHNTHLTIASELGLVGALLWASVIIAIGVTSARAWRHLPRTGLISKGLVFSFWCAGLTWLINSSVIDMRLFSFVSGLAFVWAGIIAGLGDRARTGELDGELEAPPPPPPADGGEIYSPSMREELARGI
jgi:O-antigen ligase